MTVRRLPDIPSRRRLGAPIAYSDSAGRVVDLDPRGGGGPSITVHEYEASIYSPVTNSWTNADLLPFPTNDASIPFPRAYGMLADNRFILAGGYSGVGTPLLTQLIETWALSMNSGNWTRLADMPAFRDSPLYWSDDNGLWVLGGLDTTGTRQSTLYKFDGSTWSIKSSAPGPIRNDSDANDASYPSGVADGQGRRYIICRENAVLNQYQQNWRYDPGADSWSQLALFPVLRNEVGLAYSSLNNSIYAMFGVNNVGSSVTTQIGDTNYQYSIDSNTWTARTSAPNVFFSASLSQCFYQDGFIYLIGGINSAFINHFVKYDVTNDSWSFVDRAAVPLQFTGTVTSDRQGGFYIIGSQPEYNIPAGSSIDANDATECEHWTPDNRVAFVLSWGADNVLGQLGLGDSSPHPTPTQITAIPDRVVKVVTNGNTSLFLTDQMEVWSCGDNTGGMLGIGSSGGIVVTPTPVALALEFGFKPKFFDIAIGGDGALAIAAPGRLFVWGPNTYGSLGRGNTTPVLSPTAVSGVVGSGSGLARISCGDTFSAVLLQGTGSPFFQLYTCGLDDWGQLAQSGAYSGTPVTTFGAASGQTDPHDQIVDISAGERALVAVKRNGNVVGAGRSDDYRLSAAVWGVPASRVNVLTDLSGMPGEVENARQAGRLSWFRTTDGGVWSWGTLVDYGVRGTTVTYDPIVAAVQASLPVIAAQIPAMSSEMGGFAAMSMIGSDELLYTWGYGGFDQMGSGADPETNALPVSINGLTGVLGVAMAQGVMLVIATMEPIEVVSRGRSYAQIVG